MSGLVSSYGAIFITETKSISSSVSGAFLSETSSATITSVQATQAAVEQWMNANVNALVTQIAIEEWGLSGTVGTQAIVTQVAIEEWAVNALPPTDLGGGNLAFQPIFAGDITLALSSNFAGDLAPQVIFSGTLGLDVYFTSLSGGLTPSVVFAASSFNSGPLWGSSEPCPTAPWTPSAPCPPAPWTPTAPCDPVDWQEAELCSG